MLSTFQTLGVLYLVQVDWPQGLREVLELLGAARGKSPGLRVFFSFFFFFFFFSSSFFSPLLLFFFFFSRFFSSRTSARDLGVGYLFVFQNEGSLSKNEGLLNRAQRNCLCQSPCFTAKWDKLPMVILEPNGTLINPEVTFGQPWFESHRKSIPGRSPGLAKHLPASMLRCCLGRFTLLSFFPESIAKGSSGKIAGLITQPNLHEPTRTRKMAQPNLHEPTCTRRIVQPNLHEPSSTRKLARDTLTRK